MRGELIRCENGLSPEASLHPGFWQKTILLFFSLIREKTELVQIDMSVGVVLMNYWGCAW